MTSHEPINKSLEKYENVAARVREILGDIPLPEVAERRGDTKLPDAITDEQIEQLYVAVEPLGFGRETNVTAAEAGMQRGYVAVVEGGKPNKLAAELLVVFEDYVQQGPIIFTLSRERQIGADEKEFLESRGISSEGIETEFEAGVALARSLESLDQEGAREVTFGYDPRTKQVNTEAGQAIMLGTIDREPVFAIEVSRSYNDDGNGYVQPSTKDMLVLSTQLLTQEDEQPSHIATVTGGVYCPTRGIDCAEVNSHFQNTGISTVAGMVAYGRDLMGRVTKAPSARPKEEQLLSEVAKLEEKLAALRSL